MGKLYDRADIYDLIESGERFQMYRRHWERVLDGTGIRSLLDVSIGSGSVTLPLAELGTAVSGSDLSGAMLDRCRDKAAARGYAVELHQSDFRELSCWAGRSFDCVASTGNSLPYVSNGQVRSVLAGMDALVREGGWLYFDLRNWDRILRERKRFYLYNPFFDGETRVNLVQAWDYHPDGTMTFNLLYTFEREQRIVQQEVFEEHYFPIPRQLLLDELARLATHYGFIDNGSILQEITADELETACRKCLTVTVSHMQALCIVLDEKKLEYQVLSEHQAEIYGAIEITELVNALAVRNCVLSSVQEKGEGLENYYLNLIGGKTNA